MPILLSVTACTQPAIRKRVALLTVLVGILMLIVFFYLGQYLLEQMHIGIPALRIAVTSMLFIAHDLGRLPRGRLGRCPPIPG